MQKSTYYKPFGRGIRIEPYKGQRKTLEKGDSNKDILLETLFVYGN